MIQPGVNVTKANAYAVLAPGLGVNFTKAGAYVPLAPSPIQPGVNVTKANAYAVLAPLLGLNVTKAVVYGFLGAGFPLGITLKVVVKGVKRIRKMNVCDLEPMPKPDPPWWN